MKRAVVFYDSDCLLCSKSVQFVLKHDTHKHFSFKSKPPAVPLNPLLVFSGVLLDSGSSLVIDKHHDCEDAYVFRFAEQHIDTRIEQIAEQGWAEVDDGGESKWVNPSDIKAPPLLLHCVKQDYYWMEHAGMSRIIKYCFEIQLNVAVLQP